MIITKTVPIKVNATNHKYFKELGYDVIDLGSPRWGFKYETIQVSVEHLLPNSNSKVECICDKCGRQYTQRFSRDTDICYSPCRKSDSMEGNNYGSANKGKKLTNMTGENHPRWNPNKSEYKRYQYLVFRETAKHKHIWSKWDNADKIGLCGKDDGYQVDHMVSIKYGFEFKIPPHIIGGLNNLRIITWQENRDKHDKSVKDLWDLLD